MKVSDKSIQKLLKDYCSGEATKVSGRVWNMGLLYFLNFILVCKPRSQIIGLK